jgi:excisionase family DNA binding protein
MRGRSLDTDPDEWPEPFGALAGRMPSIEIEDIEAARREALRGDVLSVQQAADRLGLSRRHVVRLVNAGELQAHGTSDASDWEIPLAAVLAFEERSRLADELADEFSRSLDAQGRPLE